LGTNTLVGQDEFRLRTELAKALAPNRSREQCRLMGTNARERRIAKILSKL